jgi:hypothetical protein
MKYVMRHGRRIEIETLPDPPEVAANLHKRGKRAQEAFARIPLWWARRANEGCGKYGPPNILVCAELFYRGFKERSKRFVMPAVKGVTRRVKLRSLRAIEEAELVTIEWRLGRSPVITFTQDPQLTLTYR